MHLFCRSTILLYIKLPHFVLGRVESNLVSYGSTQPNIPIHHAKLFI
ncbi:hypothetical protein S2091_3197 [Solimicrobium silvestre]|uniref:Uncharacterized protein n=1 Tax=Solimicrobium silvestre TaxID=2099400 RepID=A0A2S9GWG5_9BURK|nr:hypothetical protein S2091_3197 [Solimicrobium silvestre]